MDKELQQLLEKARANGASIEQLDDILARYNAKKKEQPQEPFQFGVSDTPSAVPSQEADQEPKEEDTFVEDALMSSDFYNPVGKIIKKIPGIAEVYSGVENLIGSVFKAGEMAIRENLFAYASSNPAVAATQNVLRTASPIDNKIADALGAMGDFYMESSQRTLLNKQKDYGISEEEISKGIVGNVIEGNVGTAAKLTASTVAHQIPQLAAMVAAGPVAGAGLLGTSAAGGKYAEIQDDPTLSSEEKALYSVAIGTAEGLAEYMFRTDVSQIRRAFGKKETLDQFKDILKKELKKETLLKSTLEESGEELAVGIVDLLIEDGLKGNFDNWNTEAVLELADAALVGGIMGGGVHTVTRGVNALGSSKNERKLSEIKSDISTLNEKKKNATEDQKRVIDELIEEKVGELLDVNTEDSEFYSKFSNEDIKEIISINKDIREASKKYKVAPSETLKKKYADEINTLRDKKQAIEDKYSDSPSKYIRNGKEVSRSEFINMLNEATPKEIASGQWGVQNDEEVDQLLRSKLQQDDSKEEERVPSPEQEAEAPIEEQPVAEPSEEEAPADRDVQEDEKEVAQEPVAKDTEKTPSIPLDAKIEVQDVVSQKDNEGNTRFFARYPLKDKDISAFFEVKQEEDGTITRVSDKSYGPAVKTLKRRLAKEVPTAKPAPVQEVDAEAVKIEETTIEDAEFRIEDLQSEIEIEKGNIKEARQKNKEDIAAVRKSKLSKEKKAERIEELKAELQDTLDDINGNIGIYKEEIRGFKSDIRKANKRLEKLRAPKVAKRQIEDTKKLEEDLGIKPFKKTNYIDVKDLGKDERTPKRFKEKEVKQLQTMVSNFNKVLNRLGAQPIKITFAANNEQFETRYRELTGRSDGGVGKKGSFIPGKGEIVINLSKSDPTTLPHEMLHAYIASVKLNPKKISEFTRVIESDLRKGSSSDVKLANDLAAFRDEYVKRKVYGDKTKDDAEIAEEFLAQYVGVMANQAKSLPVSQQLSFIEKIRKAIVKFLGKIGIVDKSLAVKLETREAALDFINGFVNALQGRTEVAAEINPESSAVVNSKNPYQASRLQLDVPVGSRIANEPLKDARKIAIEYMESKGLKHTDGKLIKKVDEANAKRISDAYTAMKNDPTNPEVAAAYKAMAEETLDQYEAIIKAGYKVEVNNNEPYNNSNELIEDLRNNKNMRIFSTDSGFGDEGITAKQRKENPLLAETKYKDVNGRTLLVNDVFRFVHDFFGHAERGNGFGPIGEENAWDVHSRMFSPLARKALTAETRGQNSYVNYSGVNDEAFKLRDKGRALRKEGKLEEAQEFTDKAYAIMKFAPQKVGLLPDEFVANPYLEEKVEKAEPIIKEQIDAVEIISSETPRQKAKKEAVAEILNGFADTQLPPNSSEQDLISRFLNNIFEESLYTLKKGPRESGMTWYIEDITEFENKMTVLLPELSDPNQMKLFKQVLAITSSGTNPNQNLQTAYTLWVRSNGNAVNFAKNWGEDKISFITKKGQAIGTGIIVRETKTKYVVQKVDALGNPEVFKNGTPKLFEAKKSDLKDGYPKPAGFTARGNIVAQQLTKIEKVYEAVGKDINKLIEFFEKPQPVSELRKYNKGVPDVDGNVRKVAVGKRNGAFIFGEKIGAFYQNMIGIGDTITMDLWWSRTWNRYMGTMLSTVDGKKVIQETPRTDRERDVMRKAVTLAAKKLNLDVSELQAVIWYFEQELWTKAGNVSPSFSYVTAADALNSKIKTDEQTQKRFSEAGADLTAAEKRRQDAIARANNIIAEGGIQGTVKEQIDWQPSLFGKGQVNPAIVNRTTPVQNAAVDLLQGKITNAEYQETVKITQPIEAITRFFLPASTKDMQESLDSNKGKLLNTAIEDGKEIGLRLDIPAYKNRNIWVVSVHDKGKSGKSISYGSVAWATDVKFGSNPKVAAFIAAGQNLDTLKKQDKTTIARMLGKWKNFEGKTKEDKDAAAVKKVEEIVKIENSYPGAGRKGSPWRQIGMNPFRHSWFYDRRNGKPVVAAAEVVQVGGLVYAKDVEYADWSSDQFTVDGYKDADGVPVRFQIEGDSESKVDKEVDRALEKGEIPRPLYEKTWKQKIYGALFRSKIELEVLKLQEKRDAKISDTELQAREIGNRINKYAKTPEAVKLASDYLTADDKSEAKEAILKLDKGEKLLSSLRDARAFIDNLSNKLANDPAFDALPDDLRFAIQNNITTYLRTSYRFFSDKGFDIKKRRDPAVQAQFNVLQAKEIAIMSANGMSNLDIGRHLEAIRQDLADEAAQMIDSYIADLQDVKYQPSIAGGGIKMPNAAFRKKKEIPDYIKQLLGEEKNPVQRFAQSSKSLANILYKGEMINGIINLVGENSDYILDEKPTRADRSKLYKKVEDEYSPLNGKWVHKEIMDMVEQKPLFQSDNFWINGYFNILKLGRKSKVIWNITTWRKNLTGGWYFIMANGVANPNFHKDFLRRTNLMFRKTGEGKTIGVGKFKYTFEVDEETIQLLRIMADKGVTGKSIDANLVGVSQAAYQFALDGDEKAYYERTKRIFNNIANKDKWLQEKYAAVDDYTKLIIFRSEIQSYAKKLYGKEYSELNDAQKDNVHEEAAERVKQSTPTFSRLPKWYKSIAWIPIVGDFISFRLESLRSYGMNVYNGISDVKKSQEAGLNDVQKKEYLRSGLRRLAGSGAVFALKFAITKMLANLFLGDDEEKLEEDMKKLRPEWMEGQTIIPKSIDKDGNVRVYNYSSEDPYGDVSDIFGGPVSWEAMLKDFIRPNIAASFIFNLSKGEDIYGNKIADYSDTRFNNMMAVLGYSLKQIVVPPTISSSYRDAYLKSDLPKKDKIVNLATMVAERSLIRDYKYNIVSTFYQDLRKISDTRKGYLDYDNPARRLQQLDDIKSKYESIVAIATAKNNYELIEKAKRYMKTRLTDEDEAYVFDGIIIKK